MNTRKAYIPIEDDEIENLRLESKHTIDLVQFSDISAIDPIYYGNPYYVAPDNDMAMEAYVTVRRIEEAKRAIGQVIIANRERIVALKACGKGLILKRSLQLRSTQGRGILRRHKANAEPNDDQLDLALELIKKNRV